jgi:TonB family protein
MPLALSRRVLSRESHSCERYKGAIVHARKINGSRRAYGINLLSAFVIAIIAGIPTAGWPQAASGPPSTENPVVEPEQDAAQKELPIKITVTFLPNVGDYYTGEAARARMEGVALVTICISAAGTIDSVEIKETSGQPLLDDAALRVARAVKFKPPTQGGKPVPTCTGLPVRFRAKR